MTDIVEEPGSLSMDVDHVSTKVDSQATFVEIVAQRIRDRAEAMAIRSGTLADAAGIKRTSMTNYWSGARPYPVEVMPGIAAKLSTSVDWLLTGIEGEGEVDAARVGVQEIDLAYGLGGTYSDGPVEVRTHQFPRDWLESITTAPPSSLVIARGRGDSMQPTIHHDDMVMIDCSQRTVREQDAIWALTIGDIAMIKRLRLKGARVTIESDNDRVRSDEVHHEEINIVGRVIFIGRRV